VGRKRERQTQKSIKDAANRPFVWPIAMLSRCGALHSSRSGLGWRPPSQSRCGLLVGPTGLIEEKGNG